MSEIRKIRIVTDERGFTHAYVAGTDIEIGHVVGLTIRVSQSNAFRPVAELELIDPEIDVHADVEIEQTTSYRRLTP